MSVLTPDDLAWLEEQYQRARHDETQEWVTDDEPMVLRKRYARILAALRAVPQTDAPQVTQGDADWIVNRGWTTEAGKGRAYRIQRLCEWRLAQDTTTTEEK